MHARMHAGRTWEKVKTNMTIIIKKTLKIEIWHFKPHLYTYPATLCLSVKPLFLLLIVWKTNVNNPLALDKAVLLFLRVCQEIQLVTAAAAAAAHWLNRIMTAFHAGKKNVSCQKVVKISVGQSTERERERFLSALKTANFESFQPFFTANNNYNRSLGIIS